MRKEIFACVWQYDMSGGDFETGVRLQSLLEDFLENAGQVNIDWYNRIVDCYPWVFEQIGFVKVENEHV